MIYIWLPGRITNTSICICLPEFTCLIGWLYTCIWLPNYIPDCLTWLGTWLPYLTGYLTAWPDWIPDCLTWLYTWLPDLTVYLPAWLYTWMSEYTTDCLTIPDYWLYLYLNAWLYTWLPDYIPDSLTKYIPDCPTIYLTVTIYIFLIAWLYTWLPDYIPDYLTKNLTAWLYCIPDCLIVAGESISCKRWRRRKQPKVDSELLQCKYIYTVHYNCTWSPTPCENQKNWGPACTVIFN
jgi:hypothetical protein